jgi:hypothetical protein
MALDGIISNKIKEKGCSLCDVPQNNRKGCW